MLEIVSISCLIIRKRDRLGNTSAFFSIILKFSYTATFPPHSVIEKFGGVINDTQVRV